MKTIGKTGNFSLPILCIFWLLAFLVFTTPYLPAQDFDDEFGDEEELKDLFSEFECLSTGYFDQSMFDMTSTFHWIFVGKKR